MRHYEIVLMIYPNKSLYIEDIVKYYSNIINNNSGKIHRLEDWGLRYLSYTIKKCYKAHYILMNIEVNVDFINKLKIDFKLNNNVLRYLIIKKKKSISIDSYMKIKNIN